MSLRKNQISKIGNDPVRPHLFQTEKIVKFYHFVDVSDFFCILLFVKNSRQNYISELDKMISMKNILNIIQENRK